MKIPEQSITALMRLGYSERECEFLYVVATFSGYFLRRQFTEFLGISRGKIDDRFLDNASKTGHIREIPYDRNNRRCFHLRARPIYSILGKENSANRKEAAEMRAFLKLKFLEFVLDNFNEDYLGEETDKVRFFTERRNISRDLLPAKTYENQHGSATTVRYFVDKFPLFISTDFGPAPIPVFTFFEEQPARLSSFPAHLNLYKPLLYALNSQYKMIYVAETGDYFHRAEKQFEAVLSNPQQNLPTALLKYFRLKKLWEQKKLSQLTDQDLADLNRAEKRFSQPEHETLYERWSKDEAHATLISQQSLTAQKLGQFETYLLSL